MLSAVSSVRELFLILFQHANYVCWTVPDCISVRITVCVLNCFWLFQQANYSMCAELFQIVSASELQYVCWTVSDCVSMPIRWAELFLIFSSCELYLLNCSWLLQHAKYVCWAVPDCLSMRIMCTELFLIVPATCKLCVLNCSWFPQQHANYVCCWTVSGCCRLRKYVMNYSWLFQHANYVCWAVPDCFSMGIICAGLFLFFSACWPVPDCFSMRIRCAELFLIVSACELGVVNCSWLFQHANYACWTVPFCFRMKIVCVLIC
jgi:hypothetical protein